jgi:Ni,Fe-hydrogenase III component G
MSEVTPGDLLNDLVDTHWETAARHAWRQYEQRGRGAIVFPVEPSSDGDRQPLRYLTFSDEEAAATGAFATLYELVQDYDPERQVVVAAALPDDNTVFDVYERTPAPPDA